MENSKIKPSLDADQDRSIEPPVNPARRLSFQKTVCQKWSFSMIGVHHYGEDLHMLDLICFESLMQVLRTQRLMRVLKTIKSADETKKEHSIPPNGGEHTQHHRRDAKTLEKVICVEFLFFFETNLTLSWLYDWQGHVCSNMDYFHLNWTVTLLAAERLTNKSVIYSVLFAEKKRRKRKKARKKLILNQTTHTHIHRKHEMCWDKKNYRCVLSIIELNDETTTQISQSSFIGHSISAESRS